MEDGEDSAAGPLQRMYLAESSAEASAERSQWLTKNKTKRSVHRRSQESKKRTRKSSTVESTYCRFFTSQVFRLTLHVTVVLYCSLDSTKRAMPDTFAARPTCTWRLERRKAPYACVLLVNGLIKIAAVRVTNETGVIESPLLPHLHFLGQY